MDLDTDLVAFIVFPDDFPIGEPTGNGGQCLRPLQLLNACSGLECWTGRDVDGAENGVRVATPGHAAEGRRAGVDPDLAEVWYSEDGKDWTVQELVRSIQKVATN